MATRKTAVRKSAVRKPAARRGRAPKRAAANVKQNVLVYLSFGVLFGYFLSKARATDYDSIVDMFLCRDFQIYGVILTAIAVAALGLFLLRRGRGKALSGQMFEWEGVQWDPGRLAGAFLFGTGWALAGTCPGTSLAQIGEGKLVAFATVLGIAAGVWAYKMFRPGTSAKDQVC